MRDVIFAGANYFGEILDQLPEFVLAMIVSTCCGLVIGLERESRGKPAGARTLVLICLGSAIFTQVSMLLTSTSGDPSRVAAQIVSGIGFLGAGAIIQQSERGYITGLTSAATIWVTSAIGMVVGSGRYEFAIIAVVVVVGALRLLRNLEKKLFHTPHIDPRMIIFRSNQGKTEWRLLGLLEDHMISPEEYSFRRSSEADGQKLELFYNRTNRNHRSFLADVAGMKYIVEIKTINGAH